MKRAVSLLLIAGISITGLFAQVLTVPVSGTFTDSRDGKTYKTVKIGDQVWMAENLAYLLSVSGPSVGSETEPFIYVHGYDGTDVNAAKATSNYSTYGVLYNWPASLTACPAGWHLPSDAEWTSLTDYLINNGYGYEGSGDDIAKSMAATTNWTLSSTPGTPVNDPASNNSSGFSGLPGGYRYGNGTFDGIGLYGIWWSSTEDSSDYAWSRHLNYNYTNVYRHGSYKELGFSVRCLRDESNVADTLSINLKVGWNIFSTNVIPDSTDLKTLFKGLIDDGNLQKIQDESGNAIEDIGDYGEWVNQIGSIALTEGYRIEVNDSVNIQFVGETAEFPFEIPLKTGWNIIGYPCSSEMDAMDFVQQLIDRQSLVKVQDETGNSLENIGSLGQWVNGIGYFKPGEGYKIKTSKDDTLTVSDLSENLPYNPYPPDSAVGVSLLPLLSWQCLENESDDFSFDLFLGTSVESMELISNNIKGRSYSLMSDLSLDTDFFWKVKVKTSEGNSIDGPVWKFRTIKSNDAFLEIAFPDSTNEIVEFVINDDTLQCIKVNDKYIFQGDIVLSSNQLNIVSGLKGAAIVQDANAFLLWPDKTIYYSVSEALKNDVRITDAIKHWEEKTSLEFEYRTTQENYVEFVWDKIICSSRVGMVPDGKQEITVPNWAICGNIVHEIGHTVGLIHEHSRSDRDTFITVDYNNYRTNDINIDIWPWPSVSLGDFDFTSIMLYDSYLDGAFDIYKPVLTRKDKSTWEKQREGLSENDIAMVELLYSQNGNFVDSRDGNEYDWVKIGEQVWMADNLAYLPSVSPPSDTSSIAPYYYIYGFSDTDVSAAKSTSNYSTYGVLYNWPAALTACPAGWHLPTDEEWTTLTDYLINNGYGYEGSGDDIAKSMAALTNWNTWSTPGTPGNDPASNNSSGFSGLPGGFSIGMAYFMEIGYDGAWWASTEYSTILVHYRGLRYNKMSLGRYINYRDYGYSVRCLKN